MKIFVIVTSSPWGSSLASCALRFVTAALDAGQQVPAVFFHNEGVYNAISGRLSDDGLPAPVSQWRKLAGEYGVDLLICSAAAARRLPPQPAATVPGQFSEAGLAQMWALAGDCDRVVSF